MPPIENVLRPSNFQRASLCPAAPWLEARCADTGSPEAREGTALHHAIARCIRNDPKAVGWGQNFSDEQIDVVNACVEFFREKAEGADQVFIEEPVRCELLDRDVTPDVVAIFDGGERRVIIDWKTGYAVPGYDASGDRQLACYALTYSVGGRNAVEVWRFHPRLSHEDGRVSGAVFLPEDWPKWEAALRGMQSRVEAAGQEMRYGSELNTYCNPGPQQCLYCKAKPICEAYKAWAGKGIKQVVLAGAVVGKQEMTPAIVGEVLQYGPRLKLAQKVYDQAIDRARAILAEGGEVVSPDGQRYGLKDNGAGRSIAYHDGGQAWVYAGLPLCVYDAICKAPIQKAEEMHKRETGLKGREWRERWEADMGDAITRTPKKPSVVPIKEG